MEKQKFKKLVKITFKVKDMIKLFFILLLFPISLYIISRDIVSATYIGFSIIIIVFLGRFIRILLSSNREISIKNEMIDIRKNGESQKRVRLQQIQKVNYDIVDDLYSFTIVYGESKPYSIVNFYLTNQEDIKKILSLHCEIISLNS